MRTAVTMEAFTLGGGFVSEHLAFFSSSSKQRSCQATGRGETMVQTTYEEMKAQEVKSPLLVLAECRATIADGART
jgi:hypothetical protein